jgi:hypothetical protein
MLKSLRPTFFLALLTAALTAPAYAQDTPTPLPQESPWAMRPPTPQGAGTPTAAEMAAEKEAEKGTPAQRELTRKVVDAMYSKDFAGLKALFAPSTLLCIGKNQDFLIDRMKKQFDLPISKKYKLTITKLPPGVMGPNKYSTYPMLPTHLMGMEFTDQDGDTATVNLTIGQEDGKWYEAQPCPTEAGMERFAKLVQMRQQRDARAQAAMSQVKDPVKSQLLALISKHDNVAAWRLCMSSLKMDFPTCKGIVSIMSGAKSDD